MADYPTGTTTRRRNHYVCPNRVLASRLSRKVGVSISRLGGTGMAETTAVASQKSRRIASSIAAMSTFVIVILAIRSCTPPYQLNHQSLRSVKIPVADGGKPIGTSVAKTPQKQEALSARTTNSRRVGSATGSPRPQNLQRRLNGTVAPFNAKQVISQRLNQTIKDNSPKPFSKGGNKTVESSQARSNTTDVIVRPDRRRLLVFVPAEVQELQAGKLEGSRFGDPRSIKVRIPTPLDTRTYQVNPLVQPDGYPWHRWDIPPDGSYPLNVTKFVTLLARLGKGENELGDVKPQQFTWGGVKITSDTPRMHGMVRPYVVRNGTVFRPHSKTGMWVTFVQRAVEMAKGLVDVEPRMKLLTEGDFPLIFDPNDYPWCGDDLVPVFRLNAIKSKNCMHSWPTMSLTYFNDPTNMQVAASPYMWDDVMKDWDQKYPWDEKVAKVVWRGRMTGYTYKDGERPRQKLIELAKEHTDVMDIKSSSPKNRMDQDDFQKYKAILDIDGNAWSARLGKLLCFNSVVIKVEPSYVGYWEKEMKAWVHYIPVSADLSDLEKVVRYVVAPENSIQMKQVVKNSQAFCRMKLTMEQYTVDFLWTLLAYAELLAKSPNFYQAWKNNRNAYMLPKLRMGPWGGYNAIKN